MSNLDIVLLNDSFHPQIDGVANTVKNYARVLKQDNGNPIVITPENPDANDSIFDYPVVRYPGLDVRKFIGYFAGNPFSPSVVRNLNKKDFSLFHSHCPFASTMLSRCLRDIYDKPIIMTYHTKFDIDIKKEVPGKVFQDQLIDLIVDNVSSCDEVWVVSDGAGKNLRSLGYTGEYIVMPNGVDIPKGRLSHDDYMLKTKDYNLPDNLPVFLFVGRLMWYKGIKIILDALSGLKSQDYDFRMIFVGKGQDENEIKKYANDIKVMDKCIFTGPIYDREKLKAIYCRSNLFLFPSDFDTNGLVVREAAAMSLPSVLIDKSAASEGVTKNVDGFMISNNPASLSALLVRLINDLPMVRSVGENASKNLYLSWEDAIKVAEDRYRIVEENYKLGKYPKKKNLSSIYYQLQADVMDSISNFDKITQFLKNEIEASLFYDIDDYNR